MICSICLVLALKHGKTSKFAIHKFIIVILSWTSGFAPAKKAHLNRTIAHNRL